MDWFSEVASSLRELEAASIRQFVERAAQDGYLSGRVLDYGCGKQPYRDIVEAAGGEYFPYDSPRFPASCADEDTTTEILMRAFDAILCTQVVQYVAEVGQLFFNLRFMRLMQGAVGGHLVLTYPTNWPEVEPEDLRRFTKAGMERLLKEAGFEVVRHEPRGPRLLLARPGEGILNSDGQNLRVGYGVIARA